VIGDPITLIGAGTGGANLVTTVTGITGPGYPETGFTTAANCATTVSTTSMAYNVDDYPALAKWTRSASGGSPNDAEHAYTYGSQYGPSKLYLPKGAYNACSGSIPFYGGTSFEGESAVVTGNAMIIQCNPAIPAATLAADNFRPDANVVPTASTVAEDQGNGVSFFTNLGFYSSFTSVISPAHPSGLQTPDVGALQFLNGSNTNSDIKIHNSICENISGTCFMMGFVTNTVGTLTSGATSMTVANGWSLLNGMSINIVGAGSAGGLYTGTITSAGRSNTITFTPATSTTVTAAQVMPVKDSEQFNLYDSESDVAVWYLAEGQGNVTGGVNVNDSEIFGMNSGAINFHSTAPMSVGWYNNTCNGCGSWGGYPNVLLGWAIYDKDGSNSHSATVEIDDSIFVPYDGIPILVGESTGGVYANGMFALNMSNDHFYGVEGSSGTANGVQSVENSYIDIKGSTFESVLGLNPGSNLSWFYAPINANQVSMIDVCCNAATLIHGNVSNITMIDPSGNVSGTYFDYIRGLNLEFMPNNGTFGPITKLGSFQASGGNNYFGTDIATQPLTPSTGAALGSANTFTANQTIGSSTAAANGYYIGALNGASEIQLWETGSAGVSGLSGIFPNTDLLLGFGANGTVIDSYFGPVKLVVGPGATPIESCTASTCTFSGSLANANGTLIPSTALGYQGPAAGYVQLSVNGTTGTITGTALTATCNSGTASVTGAIVGHPVAVSSTTGADVGGTFNLRASVTATNTVTVYVCGTGTPASLAYNVTVF
jgi:hypothetical protein